MRGLVLATLATGPFLANQQATNRSFVPAVQLSLLTCCEGLIRILFPEVPELLLEKIPPELESQNRHLWMSNLFFPGLSAIFPFPR